MEDYEVIKQIGKGNFGTVILCQSKADMKHYVIKCINVAEMSRSERAAALQEADLLRHLKHPFIVAYKDSFMQNNILHMVMQYCSGGDMRSKVRQAEGKYFEESVILNWFAQLVLAIFHCHRNKILHRDIKTQNIFTTGRGVLKLGDFGISRILGSTMDLAMSVVGTPYSMAPEVCANKPYGFASDMWSVGCVLYEMCTLRHAFDSDNLLGLVYKIVQHSHPPIPDVYSEELRELVDSLLEKDPAKRPTIEGVLRTPIVAQHVRTLCARLCPTVNSPGSNETSPRKMAVDDAVSDPDSKSPTGSRPSSASSRPNSGTRTRAQVGTVQRRSNSSSSILSTTSSITEPSPVEETDAFDNTLPRSRRPSTAAAAPTSHSPPPVSHSPPATATATAPSIPNSRSDSASLAKTTRRPPRLMSAAISSASRIRSPGSGSARGSSPGFNYNNNAAAGTSMRPGMPKFHVPMSVPYTRGTASASASNVFAAPSSGHHSRGSSPTIHSAFAANRSAASNPNTPRTRYNAPGPGRNPRSTSSAANRRSSSPNDWRRAPSPRTQGPAFRSHRSHPSSPVPHSPGSHGNTPRGGSGGSGTSANIFATPASIRPRRASASGTAQRQSPVVSPSMFASDRAASASSHRTPRSNRATSSSSMYDNIFSSESSSGSVGMGIAGTAVTRAPTNPFARSSVHAPVVVRRTDSMASQQMSAQHQQMRNSQLTHQHSSLTSSTSPTVDHVDVLDSVSSHALPTTTSSSSLSAATVTSSSASSTVPPKLQSASNWSLASLPVDYADDFIPEDEQPDDSTAMENTFTEAFEWTYGSAKNKHVLHENRVLSPRTQQVRSQTDQDNPQDLALKAQKLKQRGRTTLSSEQFRSVHRFFLEKVDQPLADSDIRSQLAATLGDVDMHWDAIFAVHQLVSLQHSVLR
jgi:serine/threonine protein kinase